MGYNPDRIREALRREAEGEPLRLPLSWLLAILVAVAAAAVSFNARARPRETSAYDATAEAPGS
jgi:hypothetical protein